MDTSGLRLKQTPSKRRPPVELISESVRTRFLPSSNSLEVASSDMNSASPSNWTGGSKTPRTRDAV
eukprot:scaffold3836_cov417-Prasinococcus_capsulatus_cf.AAC.11